MRRSSWRFGGNSTWARGHRRKKKRSSRGSALETLEPRQLLAVTIAEFQAINDSTLMDDDGDYEDWIEIRNSDVNAVSLDGWSLTDDSDDLQKWQFPAVTVGGGEQIVVFASDKDRTDPDDVLHTNFQLSANGEYLALVNPAGAVVQDFGTEYPPQAADQSYGLAIGRDVVPLITDESPTRAIVPTDDGLGDGWTQSDFDDQAWFSGEMGVGYENLRPGFETRDDFDGAEIDPVWTVDIPVGGGSTVELNNGQLRLTVPEDQDTTFTSRGLAPLVYRDLPGVSPADYEIVTQITQGANDRGNPGIGIVDGSTGKLAVQLEYNNRLNFRLWAGGENQGSRISQRRTSYFLRLARDSSEGTWTGYYKLNEADNWIRVSIATDGVDDTPIISEPKPAIFGRTPTGVITANFEFLEIIVPDQRPVYGPEVGLNIGDEMFNNNASAYIRVPFSVEGDPARFEELGMTVRYDDGFRAFINGVEVADRNVPIESTWNSEASATFGAVNGQIPTVPINLSSAIANLQTGDNVLAIHGMNVSSLDSDFFFDAQLVASDVLSETEQFFITPTPNEPNDLPAAPSPVLVGEQGVFYGSRTVSLELPVDRSGTGDTVHRRREPSHTPVRALQCTGYFDREYAA